MITQVSETGDLNSTTQAIEPCPFCGAEARVVDKAFDDQHRAYCRVECRNGHALYRWGQS